MKEMSYVSLANILLSSVEDDEKAATQEDIYRYCGQEETMDTSTINILIICATILTLSWIVHKGDKA